MPAWRQRRPTNGARITNDDVSCASVHRLSDAFEISERSVAWSNHHVATPTRITVATLATTM